jgi:hypothetical protein
MSSSQNNARLLDARTLFYMATAITPAMAVKSLEGDSNMLRPRWTQKATTLTVARTTDCVCRRTCRSRLLVDHSLRHADALRLANRPAGHGSDERIGDRKTDADGSTDIYFGPKAPAGQENNWIQTVPSKSWFNASPLRGVRTMVRQDVASEGNYLGEVSITPSDRLAAGLREPL